MPRVVSQCGQVGALTSWLTAPALCVMYTFVLTWLALYQLVNCDYPIPLAAQARSLIYLPLLAGVLRALVIADLFDAAPRTSLCANQVRFKAMGVRVCLTALLVLPAFMSELFSTYSTSSFVFDFLFLYPILMMLAPRYVRWAEARRPHPNDDYFQLGAALAKKSSWDARGHRSFVLMWGVKLLFIPLMYSMLIGAAEALLVYEWAWNPVALVAGVFLFGLSVDLIIATGGYVFASRLLNTEVVSTDSTVLGWAVCIICYPPLLDLMRALSRQTDEIVWSDHFLTDTYLYWIWACLIALSWIGYWSATVSFGFRFSNLSWRGLVDTGLYRYVKHPAYLSKNLYWWLHTVPFVAAEGIGVLQNVLGLAFVSGIYYLRAKTEERHLMRFPEYVAYAERLSRTGLFSCLRRRAFRWLASQS